MVEAHWILKEQSNEKFTFNYQEAVYNYFYGRHAAGDNNKQRMQPISLEEKWNTVYWEKCALSFFLGVSCANAQYVYQYSGIHPKESVPEFHKKMAQDLSNNLWMPDSGQSDHLNQQNPWKCKRKDFCQLGNIPPIPSFLAPKS